MREGVARPDPSFPILSPLRPVLRCSIGGTNTYDCPIPALSSKCGSGLTCSYLPPVPPPSPPPSPPSPPSVPAPSGVANTGTSDNLDIGIVIAISASGACLFLLACTCFYWRFYRGLTCWSTRNKSKRANEVKEVHTVLMVARSNPKPQPRHRPLPLTADPDPDPGPWS